MVRTWLSLMVLALVSQCTLGCQATRTVGRKTGKATVAVPLFVAEGLINGILDSDETILERERRERQSQQWKQYWRDHPDENHSMHEAFKDDYE